ncbi:MAG: SET domain-containing protein [Planctomycetota bacterium]|nr:SET domain-containing protein [Planctomycetota bacterium]
MAPPVLFDEIDERFQIARSTIPGAGLGLFAKIPLAAGERLMIRGATIRSGSIADQCTAYADLYKIRVGPYLLIPIGFAAMINHSDDRYNLDRHLEDTCGWLVTNQAVSAGEELFIKYSEFALNQFPIDKQSP